MKKLFLAIFISCLFLTGCKTDEVINETNQTQSLTKEEKAVLEFLTSNVLDTSPTYKNNRFYIFTEDGKYLHYYGSRIVLNEFDNILIDTGTYEYKGGTLYLNHLYNYTQKYYDESNTYKLELLEDNRTESFEDFKIVVRERSEGDFVYLSGKGLRIEKKNDNVPKELVELLKTYLENDFKDLDFNKLKSLEEYDQ